MRSIASLVLAGGMGGAAPPLASGSALAYPRLAAPPPATSLSPNEQSGSFAPPTLAPFETITPGFASHALTLTEPGRSDARRVTASDPAPTKSMESPAAGSVAAL